MTIDRSKHDHGIHDVLDRLDDAVGRGVRDHTPINKSDLAQVHLAELDPHVADGSLQGSVKHFLENGSDYAREGHSAHGGNNYEWDGEELKRRFCKP